MGPEPEQAAATHVDLGDTVHSGPQTAALAFERRLDAEEVATGLGRRDRRDPVDREGPRLAGQGLQREPSALPRLDEGNIAAFDLEDHAVVVPGGDLEEDLAPLDRRAQGLGEVAVGDDAVEGRDQAGTLALLGDQLQLGLGLLDLGLQDPQLGAIAIGHGRSQLLAALLALGLPFARLEPQVCIFEHAQHVSLLDEIPRPQAALGDEGRHRGHDRPLDDALELCGSGHTVGPGEECQAEDQQDDSRHRDPDHEPIEPDRVDQILPQ